MNILEFLTSDGYRFHYDADSGEWSDGDLTFRDVDGVPVDDDGLPLFDAE